MNILNQVMSLSLVGINQNETAKNGSAKNEVKKPTKLLFLNLLQLVYAELLRSHLGQTFKDELMLQVMKLQLKGMQGLQGL